MRKLSKAMKEGKIEISYAHCCICQETFIDDLVEHVMCPNGCPVLLQKGYVLPDYDFEESPFVKQYDDYEQPCLWDSMPETFPGSGTKVGHLACPCPKCRINC